MRFRITSLTILTILILSITACGSSITAVLQENTGDSQVASKNNQSDLAREHVSTTQDKTDYRFISFDPDPLISTTKELENRRLPTLDELYNSARDLNQRGNFGYIITKGSRVADDSGYDPDSTVILHITNPQNNISAKILFYKTYSFCKAIYFETAPEQTMEAEKMLWFARHLFGNLPDEAFPDLKPDSHSSKYLYTNGEIMYRYYLFIHPQTAYGTKENSVQYTLSHCYNSIEQFKEFYSVATPVTIPEFPDYFLSKGILKTNAKAEVVKLHESGEYYEGTLYDDSGNSMACRIDNIRTDDTKGDIEKATVFFGSFLGGYYDISFYY